MAYNLATDGRPCPFCGSTMLSLVKSWNTLRVTCDGCGAAGPEVEESEAQERTAIEQWNKRV